LEEFDVDDECGDGAWLIWRLFEAFGGGGEIPVFVVAFGG
jgi:hypothetical protein